MGGHIRTQRIANTADIAKRVDEALQSPESDYNRQMQELDEIGKARQAAFESLDDARGDSDEDLNAKSLPRRGRGHFKENAKKKRKNKKKAVDDDEDTEEDDDDEEDEDNEDDEDLSDADSNPEKRQRRVTPAKAPVSGSFQQLASSAATKTNLCSKCHVAGHTIANCIAAACSGECGIQARHKHTKK